MGIRTKCQMLFSLGFFKRMVVKNNRIYKRDLMDVAKIRLRTDLCEAF